jgi:hypothetical protein
MFMGSITVTHTTHHACIKGDLLLPNRIIGMEQFLDVPLILEMGLFLDVSYYFMQMDP